MFSQTTAPIRDQIRPFTRQIRPLLTHANEGSEPLEKTVRSFGNAVGGFNSFLNELSYKPKGSKESVLFYLPWLNHNFNAAFNLQDAGGPVLRSLIQLTCNGSYLGYGVANNEPFIRTLLQTANIPAPEEIPDSSHPSGHCDLVEGPAK
jgi:phospholipid/cholesterol/gamma-HCH transport system substrate-binding protein